MPDIYTKQLERDSAVYWPPMQADGDPYPNGGITTAPVQVNVRWIEAQDARLKQSSDVVLVAADLEAGGFLRRGTLADLTPDNMKQYPPQSPEYLGNPATHHAFNGDLNPTVGVPFEPQSGTIQYVSGPSGLALQNDGDDFDIEQTISPEGWALPDDITFSYWVKVAANNPATDTAALALTFVGQGLTINCRAGLVNRVEFAGYEWDMDAGWADSFVNLQVVYRRLNDPLVYLSGFPVDISIPGTLPSVAFSDDFMRITGTAIDAGGSNLPGDVGVDDLRSYRQSIEPREVQLMAGAHPLLYADIEEIQRYQKVYNIPRTKFVRKAWLSQ